MAASLWNPLSGFGLSNFFGVSLATPTTNPAATVVYSEAATSVVPDWSTDKSADLTTNLPADRCAGVLETTRCLYEDATDYISTLMFGKTVTPEPESEPEPEPAAIPVLTPAHRLDACPSLAWLNACIASAFSTRGYFEPVLWFYENYAHKYWSAYASKPPGFFKGPITRSYAWRFFAFLSSSFTAATRDSSLRPVALRIIFKILLPRGKAACSYAFAQLLAWKETGTFNMGLTLFALAAAFYNAWQCCEMEEALDQLEIETETQMEHLANRAVALVQERENVLRQHVAHMENRMDQQAADLEATQRYVVRAERAFRRRMAAMERAMRRHAAGTTEPIDARTEDVTKAMVKYSPMVDGQDTASAAEDRSSSGALAPLSPDRKRKTDDPEELESRCKVKIDNSSPRTPPRSATRQQQSLPSIPSSPFSFSIPSSLNPDGEH